MELAIKNTLTEEIIREAAKRYSTPFESVKSIGGFENFVFEFSKNGKNFILRFVHSKHRKKEQVMAELEFIEYLDKNDASVSTVVHSQYNNIIEIIYINDVDYFSICSFEKAIGNPIKKEDLTDEFYIRFGTEVGKLHKLTKSYKFIHKRINWDEELYIDLARKSLGKNDQIIIEIYEKLIKKLQLLPKNIDNFGLIHTDLHFGNMFIYGDKLTFFDWDDASYKHFISDIAIVIFYHFFLKDVSQQTIDDYSHRILALFLKGYNIENSLDLKELENINDFLMLRTIVLYIVISAMGEKEKQEKWAQNYFEKSRSKILNNTPFLTLDIVLKGLI